MHNIVPVKSLDIEITSFDNGGFLITHTALNYRINVNETVINLLNLVDGQRTIHQICHIFFRKHKKNMTPNSIHHILFDKLGKYHIIENERHKYQTIGKPDYLKLSTTLLKKEWVSPITNFLSYLFSEKIFYPLLCTSLFIVLGISITQYNTITTHIEKLQFSHLIFVLTISFITVVLHEFGHASACKKLGAKHGDIGFGFYLLSPVMYADVSDIWKLKRNKRIIVNLAGVYIQLLIALLMGFVFMFTDQIEYLLTLYFLGVISVFINLNPFFRTDGYWILSDITGVSNLRKLSNSLLKDFALWIIKRKRFIFSKKNVLLLLYAVISTSLIGIFLGAILWYDSLSIYNFPINFFNLIKEFLMGERELNLETIKKLIVPLSFYILMIKLLINLKKSNSAK